MKDTWRILEINISAVSGRKYKNVSIGINLYTSFGFKLQHTMYMHLPPVCASNRLVAMASISSINIIAGAFSLASLNTSLTIRGPSPKYFWTNSEPTTLMKAAKTKTSVKLFVNQYTVICTLLAKEITKIHGFIIQYNLILSLIERRVCKF